MANDNLNYREEHAYELQPGDYLNFDPDDIRDGGIIVDWRADAVIELERTVAWSSQGYNYIVNEDRIDEHDSQATARFEVVFQDYLKLDEYNRLYGDEMREIYGNDSPSLDDYVKEYGSLHMNYGENITIDGYGRMYDKEGEVVRDVAGHALHFASNPTINFGMYGDVGGANYQFKGFEPPLTRDHQLDHSQDKEVENNDSEREMSLAERLELASRQAIANIGNNYEQHDDREDIYSSQEGPEIGFGHDEHDAPDL